MTSPGWGHSGRGWEPCAGPAGQGPALQQLHTDSSRGACRLRDASPCHVPPAPWRHRLPVLDRMAVDLSGTLLLADTRRSGGGAGGRGASQPGTRGGRAPLPATPYATSPLLLGSPAGPPLRNQDPRPRRLLGGGWGWGMGRESGPTCQDTERPLSLSLYLSPSPLCLSPPSPLPLPLPLPLPSPLSSPSPLFASPLLSGAGKGTPA